MVFSYIVGCTIKFTLTLSQPDMKIKDIVVSHQHQEIQPVRNKTNNEITREWSLQMYVTESKQKQGVVPSADAAKPPRLAPIAPMTPHNMESMVACRCISPVSTMD